MAPLDATHPDSPRFISIGPAFAGSVEATVIWAIGRVYRRLCVRHQAAPVEIPSAGRSKNQDIPAQASGFCGMTPDPAWQPSRAARACRRAELPLTARGA